MTEQENKKQEKPVTKHSATQKPDSARGSVAHDTSIEQLGLSNRVVAVLNEAGLNTEQDVLTLLAKGDAELLAIPGIGDKTLEEIRKSLSGKEFVKQDAEEETEQETQASATPEKALAQSVGKSDVRENTAIVEAKNVNQTTILPEQEGVEKRISFIVRLTVDEAGKPLRTEVEHAQSSKKEAFAGLNTKRLTDFMEKYTGESITSESKPQPTVAVPSRIPTSEFTPLDAQLIISDVQIIRKRASVGMDMILNPHEDFWVRVNFQLIGSHAASLAARGVFFELKLYANELITGNAKLLDTFEARLFENILEYAPEINVTALSPGYYRLRTIIMLKSSAGIADHHQGLFFKVSGEHLLAGSAITSQKIAPPLA